MINFHYQNDFTEINAAAYREWLSNVADSERQSIRKLEYVFCDDDYLLDINQKFLDHDTFTDIVTFDYNSEGMIEGEVYISTDRVSENANTFKVDFNTELNRVMAHGLLHLMGYGDKSDAEKAMMRAKEVEKMEMFHVKQ